MLGKAREESEHERAVDEVMAEQAQQQAQIDQRQHAALMRQQRQQQARVKQWQQQQFQQQRWQPQQRRRGPRPSVPLRQRVAALREMEPGVLHLRLGFDGIESHFRYVFSM